MGWATPEYSRKAVDRAGAVFINPRAAREDRELALTVLNNWRSSHSYPLNTLQINLRGVAAQFDSDATVAQRVKRLPSIRHKLERFPGMQLSRMQDIGGCRAVVASVDEVLEIAEYYRSKSRIKHVLVRDDPYIDDPKPSGYRGVHLVYAYKSDRNDTYDGLKIEIQIRSRLQHAWATAVEIVGTLTQQALKSSWGEEDWLRFFALMSSSMAFREGTELVPGTPRDPDTLQKELKSHVRKLNVIKRLTAYGTAVNFIEDQLAMKNRGHTFLLELDIGRMELEVRTYDNPAIATEAYGAIERAIEGNPEKDAVLVSVESVASLRRAFPNYFLDTHAFVQSVEEAIA